MKQQDFDEVERLVIDFMETPAIATFQRLAEARQAGKISDDLLDSWLSDHDEEIVALLEELTAVLWAIAKRRKA
jgi:hypothetical protein